MQIIVIQYLCVSFLDINDKLNKIMKKLLFILLFPLIMGAQDNNLAIITSPGAYDDGFNIGVQYTYFPASVVYTGVELFYFPDLNDITYTHLMGRFGLHKEWGNYNKKLRLYGGFRIGKIFREGYNGPYVSLGQELGIQFTVDCWFIKLAWSHDDRTDSAIWNVDHFEVNSGWAGIGMRW